MLFEPPHKQLNQPEGIKNPKKISSFQNKAELDNNNNNLYLHFM